MTMNRSYIIAGILAALLALWLLSGMFEGKEPAPETSIAAEHPLTTVRAAVLTSQDYVGSVTIRGQTQAIRKVELRSEIDAQIVKLPVEKGGRVKEGDLICQLSVDDRQARLQEAEALARQRELEASAAKRLAEKGHRSATQTAAAMAQYDAAKAQVMQIEIELENTKIRAPFGGILNERPVEIGAYLQKGDSCATLVEEDPYLVIGNVSEQDVGSLSVGDIGFATLATGQTMEGKIRYISAVANETTRTFKVELIVANSDRTLRDGITTVITVPRPAAQAHLLSPAFLTLDDSGQIGVRVLNSDNIVAFRPVTIVGNNESGVWIRGLSEQETVITVGHEFVRAGQKVNVDNGLGGNT